MTIQIFVTGGTFDKQYNELTGDLTFNRTHLKEMLKLGRSKVDVEIETLMMIDSLDMTAEDRMNILQACKQTNHNHMLITHGTDTMIQTATLLAKHIPKKTIVLTGAMIPFEFGSSDGLFNLGSAIAFTQTLPFGVYVAMNGRYFLWNNVRKNKELGVFEEK